jgi:S1-C subfamily serine protease
MINFMVVHPLSDIVDPTPPAPPPTPPSKRPGRGTLVLGSLLVIGALVGGGIGAGAVLKLAPAAPAAAATSSPAAPAASSAPAASTLSVSALYQAAVKGVVTITTQIPGRFGSVGQGTGSGIVLDQNGDILTNAHVVSDASQVQVTFNDGQTVSGSVSGVNTTADLAVVKVSVAASSLHPLPLGNSNNVLIGDSVYAIGAPFELSGSLTAGIVSGLNRTNPATGLTGLIQTDARINPGNSGGPLLNTQGQVIGINESIDSPVAGSVGVGFAIPVNLVKQLVASLEGGANQ